MYLQYGSVTLKVIDLTRFERETVWTEDQADLLYIRTTLGVTATYAAGGDPALPSARLLAPNTKGMLAGTDATADSLKSTPRGFNPGDGPGGGVFRSPFLETDTDFGALDKTKLKSGPETDAELRGYLWVPRQKLILYAYARETGVPIRWLESPRPGFTTDLGNGPKPLSVDVVSASGEPNSVAVHFQVQTDMSPCPSGSDRLVLSHRWQMSHGHDEHFYLTRTIVGTIVFNGAVMRAQGMRPDFVRAQFIHPVPIGFQRAAPLVVQSSDGLTIRYTITDTDPTITFDPGNSGATNIQIVERVQQSVQRGFPSNT